MKKPRRIKTDDEKPSPPIAYTEPKHYKDYVGQYGKRFYQPFTKEYIRKIDGFIDTRRNFAEFHFEGDDNDYWYDCEDTCIITNELPIKDIPWVANVYHKDYKGYNPFNGKEKLGGSTIS